MRRRPEPHPSAVRSIGRVAEVMRDAAVGAGAPAGAINWMTTVTLEGTQELMRCREVAVVLATGGSASCEPHTAPVSQPTASARETPRPTSSAPPI